MPITPTGLVLDSEAAANRGFAGLHGWMRKAEAAWGANGEGEGMTLTENWNHYNKLSSQFPIAPLRIVYAKSGTLPAACVLAKSGAVIDHMLYWTAPASGDEARYLAAILNSETARQRIAQYQSRGQWGARHFDKVIFNLRIPRFDSADGLHGTLADAASEAEHVAAGVELPEAALFQRARRVVRTALAEAGLSQRIDALVARLLDAG